MNTMTNTKECLELIEKNTDDPFIAKNWHFNGVIDRIEKEIADCLALAVSCHSLEDKDIFQMDAETNQQTLDNFLSKWPKPKVTVIKDSVELSDTVATDWLKLPLLHARPLEPLICKTCTRTHSFIIYENPRTNAMVKVINQQYNKPNAVVIREYSY